MIKTPHLSLSIALLSLLVVVVGTGAMLREDARNARTIQAELADAVSLAEKAPPEGDFEIHIPSSVLPGDLQIARIEGKSTVEYPEMATAMCLRIVKAADDALFAFIEVRNGQKLTRIPIDQRQAMAVVAACGRLDGRADEHISLVLERWPPLRF